MTNVPAGRDAKGDPAPVGVQSDTLFTDRPTGPSASDEWAPKSESPTPAPAAPTPATMGSLSVPQAPHSAAVRHRRTRHTAHAQPVQPPPPGPQLRPPTPQLRPPVQAIQDLFERHSDLAR
jgi:hypothetical protein